MFTGDNFTRATGDAVKLASLQLYEFEAYDKGQNLHLNADPTTIEMMNKIYRLLLHVVSDKCNMPDSFLDGDCTPLHVSKSRLFGYSLTDTDLV